MNRNELGGLRSLFVVFLIIQVASFIPSISSVDTSTSSRFSIAQDEIVYRHHFPITISRSEDFIGLGIEGSGTQEDPFVIENLNITAATGNCITISDVTEYLVIRNCFLKSTSYFYSCIELSNVNNSRIEDCFIDGTGHGIETYNSNGTAIRNCVLYGASHGVHLGYSWEIEVSECRILRNSFGIQIDGSDDCNISSNLVYSNSNTGIHIGPTANGNRLSRNKIGWNGHLGEIPDNAADHGNGTIWEANHWSDYDPPGPYTVEGNTGSNDTTPQLLRDSEDPVVEPHEDIFFSDGTTGMELTWFTSDEFPVWYEIIFHNEYTISKPWLHQSITFPLDGIPPGNHQFTLRVHDGSNRVASDSVYVTVFVIIFSDIGSPMLTFASIGSAVAVIAALVLFKMKQRM